VAPPKPERSSIAPDIMRQLELRLGRSHARQRLGIETDHEAQIFGQGLNLFHIENFYSIHGVIRGTLRLLGLYGRGRRNAARVVLRHNDIWSKDLPPAFDGFTILHLSDLHADISGPAMNSVIALLKGLEYGICVLTGDYRGKTFGACKPAMDGVARVCAALHGPLYGVLGNHDSIQMVPPMEAMGIHVLLNESVVISRDGQDIHLAGIDDAHFYRVDNIEKAGHGIAEAAFSILLSHTPEVYRQAAHAGFDVMLSGHTHGGQVCLPGSVAITLDSSLPRRLGAGAWDHAGITGYTSVGAGASVVAVRFNCPPEITLHHLRRG
jgi:predicted MPP superfamily phosphohydrolase